MQVPGFNYAHDHEDEYGNWGIALLGIGKDWNYPPRCLVIGEGVPGDDLTAD